MERIDPVAVVMGGASTCVALVVGVPVLPAVLIGAVTLTVAAVGQALWTVTPAAHTPGAAERPAAPTLHPEERRWMEQASHAVSVLRHGVRSLDGGPLQERLAEVAVKAEGALADLHRVAAQVTATRRASSQLDLPQLSRDLSRLTATLERSSDADVIRDLQRSVEAVREQLRVGRRLANARVGLQARIEAGTLGLQQLAAQVNEMTALAPPGGGAWSHGELIDELTTQLDALRAGLGDAAVMSRRALGVTDVEGGDDVPVDA